MLQLKPVYINTVKKILKKYIPEKQVLVFGSRVTKTFKPHSDIDLCVMGDAPLSLEQLATLRDAFSESSLPMRVDIVDWTSITPEFRSIIMANYIQLM